MTEDAQRLREMEGGRAGISPAEEPRLPEAEALQPPDWAQELARSFRCYRAASSQVNSDQRGN